MSTPPNTDPLRESIAKHGADPNEVLGPELDVHTLRAQLAERDAQLRQLNTLLDVQDRELDELLRLAMNMGPQIRDYLARELDEHATAAENAITQGAQVGRPPNPALVERAATLRLWQSLIGGKTFNPNLPEWAKARLAALVEPEQPPPPDCDADDEPRDSGGPLAASKARSASAARRFGRHPAG